MMGCHIFSWQDLCAFKFKHLYNRWKFSAWSFYNRFIATLCIGFLPTKYLIKRRAYEAVILHSMAGPYYIVTYHSMVLTTMVTTGTVLPGTGSKDVCDSDTAMGKTAVQLPGPPVKQTLYSHAKCHFFWQRWYLPKTNKQTKGLLDWQACFKAAEAMWEKVCTL